ncbi:MAG: hypothetical protein WDW38_003833 [Sanguina aurantia]
MAPLPPVCPSAFGYAFFAGSDVNGPKTNCYYGVNVTAAAGYCNTDPSCGAFSFYPDWKNSCMVPAYAVGLSGSPMNLTAASPMQACAGIYIMNMFHSAPPYSSPNSPYLAPLTPPGVPPATSSPPTQPPAPTQAPAYPPHTCPQSQGYTFFELFDEFEDEMACNTASTVDGAAAFCNVDMNCAAFSWYSAHNYTCTVSASIGLSGSHVDLNDTYYNAPCVGIYILDALRTAPSLPAITRAASSKSHATKPISSRPESSTGCGASAQASTFVDRTYAPTPFTHASSHPNTKPTTSKPKTAKSKSTTALASAKSDATHPESAYSFPQNHRLLSQHHHRRHRPFLRHLPHSLPLHCRQTHTHHSQCLLARHHPVQPSRALSSQPCFSFTLTKPANSKPTLSQSPTTTATIPTSAVTLSSPAITRPSLSLASTPVALTSQPLTSFTLTKLPSPKPTLARPSCITSRSITAVALVALPATTTSGTSHILDTPSLSPPLLRHLPSHPTFFPPSHGLFP